MNFVRVGPTRTKVSAAGNHRTVAPIDYGGQVHQMWIATSGDIPFLEHERGDIWLPAILSLAMRRREDIVMRDPISDRRREAVERVQDIFLSWYPKRLSRVSIKAPRSDASRRRRLTARRTAPNDGRAPDSRAAATCFTGGVDSFFSLVSNPEIGAMVYAFGLDIPLHRRAAAQRVDAELRHIAREFGVDYLWARTNLRGLFGKQVSWGYETHGAVLASVGLVLSPAIESLRIPSTHTHAVNFPWGSHPSLDPLWSTRRLTVIHDGAETSRAAKTSRLADEALAQKHLRVCFMQFTEHNCSRCMKCMRTMATLTLLGRLDAFTTFTQPLDLERLRAQTLVTKNDVYQMEDVLALGKSVPGHEVLKEAIQSLVTAYYDKHSP